VLRVVVLRAVRCADGVWYVERAALIECVDTE
jgi:hypothetical protein